MRFSRPTSLAAAWLAGISVAEAQAQFLVDQLSFGHTGRYVQLSPGNLGPVTVTATARAKRSMFAG